MIPAPLLLIAGPLAVAALVYPLRRITPVASLFSAAATIGLAWLTNAIPQTTQTAILGGRVVGGAQVILGRTLELSPSDRPVLMVLSLAAALLFLLPAGLPRSQAPDILFPGLLALLGVMAAILVVETFVFSVLLVQVAAGVTTILLQGSRFGSTRGGWRFFLFTTLAMPLLLVAGWRIDFQAANPAQINLLNPAVLLLTFGFLIYLAAVPFHLWIAPAAGQAQPWAQVVAFGFFPMVTFSVITGALEQFPWWAGSAIPFQWFTFAGTLTAGLGAILIFSCAGHRGGCSADSLGQLAGYNLLVDNGALLLLLGSKSDAALPAAGALLLLRMASLIIWAVGLSNLRWQANAKAAAIPAGWQGLLGTAVLALGGLSLAGFPLTPGFSARWIAVGLVARDNLGPAALLLLGSASGMVGVLRMVRTAVMSRVHYMHHQERKWPPSSSPRTQGESTASPPPAGRWNWLTTTVLIIVILVAIALALYPQPIIAAAGRAASHFSYIAAPTLNFGGGESNSPLSQSLGEGG